MTTRKQEAPPQIVADFVARLPDTIRENTAFIVFMYAFPPDDLDAAISEGRQHNFTKLIQDRLTDHQHWPEQMGLLIRLVGALDYYLAAKAATADSTTETSRKIAEGMPDFRVAQEVALRAPLAGKHHQAAATKWAKLREGPLGLQGLVRYEHALQARRNPLPTTLE
jgi:hypothetical protein